MAEVVKILAGALGSFLLTVIGLAIALLVIGVIVFVGSYIDLAPGP